MTVADPTFLRRLQLRCQVGLDCLRLVARCIALEYRAVGADEELGEVPFDRLRPKNPWLLRLEVLVERVRISTVHVDLGEHREGDAVVPGTKLLDLRFAMRLLMPELITGKPEHHKSPIFEFVVERLQPGILRREAALARDVDNEQRLAAVEVHLLRLAVDGDKVDVVQVHPNVLQNGTVVDFVSQTNGVLHLLDDRRRRKNFGMRIDHLLVTTSLQHLVV